MLDAALVEGLIVGLIQTLLVLFLAPLLLGITNRVKARLQYRRGASLLQPYRDLAKWWAKTPLESDRATPLSSLAPALVFGALFVASLLLPLVTSRPPLAG